MRSSVFISYSHRDRDWLNRVNIHLRPLVRDNAIDVWDDTKIAPGSEWKAEIESALANAKVAILLISADFLASDFVAGSEIPPLLLAAREDGAIILPLIISPSRFSRTPSLAQFQSVNDPARPLIALSESEQEEVLDRLSQTTERALSVQSDRVVPTPASQDTRYALPLLGGLRLAECLNRLGCRNDLVAQEEEFIKQWVTRRSTETSWLSEGMDIPGYLADIGERDEIRSDVRRLVDQLVACCAPQHGKLSSIYISSKKTADAYRLLKREIEAARPLGADDSIDKLTAVHEFLLKTNRLTFLPARILLDGGLPSSADEVCYFVGSFTLDVDEAEVARVPGAAEVMAEKTIKSLYGVVANVFQNSDPFAYPLLRFNGHLGTRPVTTILSRKYIQFSSMTATFLTEALTGRRLDIQGIGTMKRVDTIHEVHPLACGMAERTLEDY